MQRDACGHRPHPMNKSAPPGCLASRSVAPSPTITSDLMPQCSCSCNTGAAKLSTLVKAEYVIFARQAHFDMTDSGCFASTA